jgi:hypothetical protein
MQHTEQEQTEPEITVFFGKREKKMDERAKSIKKCVKFL